MGLFEDLTLRSNGSDVDAGWWNTIIYAMRTAFPDYTAIAGDVVGTTDTQDLSNKTFTDALTLQELGSTPSTPASGDKKLYPKTNGKLYTLDDAGTEVELGAGTATLNVVSKTTTYAALTTDEVIVCTAASAWSLTVYTAASNSGKKLIIKKTDANFNAITISGTGLTTTYLNTEGETLTLVSDGTNWVEIDRVIPSFWQEYTPTMDGINVGGGTVSEETFWRRSGDSIEIQFAAKITAGGTSTSAASVAVPSGVTLDSAKIAQVVTVTGLSSASSYNISGATGYDAIACNWIPGSDKMQFTEKGTGSYLVGNDFTSNDELAFWGIAPVTNWAG